MPTRIFIGLCVVFILSGSSTALAALVSKIVGKVGDYYLTSREVVASRLLEKELFPEQKVTVVESGEDPAFVMQVTAVILEKVVSLEAESFSVAAVSEEDEKEFIIRAKRMLAGQKAWQKLDMSAIELQDLVARKLRSKKFLKYKTESSSLTVTDFEVKEYYEKSRYKFGSIPFESFKENIRQFLIQKQTEDRLREWFEVLRKKYQVRNYLAEST
ncbi:MAG: hypothetical protein RJB66_2759 [Pseudomonadota bacterium]